MFSQQVKIEGGFDVSYPRMIRVRQKFQDVKIDHIDEAIRQQFLKEDVRVKIKPGMRVAVAVGSRGIANLQQIAFSTVKEIKGLGGEPFIVPAMGSHGGATAEGQLEILQQYGITEESMGCPILSSMQTVQVGQLPNGLPLYFDQFAYESDAIVAIGRVKPHTDFKGPIESGLLKMLVIGLGKHKGASVMHSYGFDRFHELIPAAGQALIEKTKIVIGLAVIENAYDETYQLIAVPAEKIMDTEPHLLKQAKQAMAKLLVDRIDVLVVDEIGKDISGAGMDPNITGRTLSGLNEGLDAPPIQKIVVRDLTEKTHGNATGLGAADVITKRCLEKIDFAYTYANTITSTLLTAAKIPIVLQNDMEALAVAAKTCNRITMDKIKIVWIKNTLDLEHIYVSEPYLEDLRHREDLKIAGEAEPIQFDQDGNLLSPFQLENMHTR